MRAITYCRESEEDRRGKERNKKDFITTSIRNQEEDSKEIASKFGDEIIRVFKDVNVSSTDSNRKGFNEALDYIPGHLPLKVYIKDYTRLGRHNTVFTLRDKLVKAGVKKEHIFFWNEPSNNGINFESDGMIGIKSSAYYLNIEKNRDDYYRLIERKTKEKMPIINPPYGYKWKNKTWIVISKKIINILKVFEDYLNNINYKETCELLKICKSLYYRILHNYKLYYGIIEYQIDTRDSFNNVTGKKIISYECDYEKIISKEMFEKVQNKLQIK